MSGAPEVTQVSSMPPPPHHYFKLYTDEAVKKGTAPKPPPPMADTYSMFGIPINNDDAIIQSLESQGIKRLNTSKDIDRKKELRKLNHSILLNFLDLIDILIKCPESNKREEKIEDINLLFIHMHHLINEFRPHQARETLRVMLMIQKRKRVQFTNKFKEHLEKVKNIIQEAIDGLPDSAMDQGDAIESQPGDVDDPAGGCMLEDGDEVSAGGQSDERDTCSRMDRLMCGIVDQMELANNMKL